MHAIERMLEVVVTLMRISDEVLSLGQWFAEMRVLTKYPRICEVIFFLLMYQVPDSMNPRRAIVKDKYVPAGPFCYIHIILGIQYGK